MHISEKSEDTTDFRTHLVEQFSFDENQAQAIIDMRNRVFTLQERKRISEELQLLLCKEKTLS